MPVNWEYEWCKMCERPNKIGFSVSDEDWRNIVPDEMKNGNGILCYNCFETLAYKKRIPFTILGLFPVSRVEGCRYTHKDED